ATRIVVHGTPDAVTACSAPAFARKYPSGIASAPTTEMSTTCRTSARAAARIRFAVATSSLFGPSGQVQHRLDPGEGGVEARGIEQVAGDVLDPLAALVIVAGEHAHVAADRSQSGYDQAAQCSCPAGDQDLRT